MISIYGFDDSVWSRARREARDAMVSRAKDRRDITYSELVTYIHAIDFDAHDQRLFHLLYEISTEESNQGRGMLTAIVVHKNGDKRPGSGFFELAESLGLDTKDRDSCRIGELHKIYAYWTKTSFDT